MNDIDRIAALEARLAAAEADSKRHLVQAGVWAAKAGLIQGKLDAAEAALSEARSALGEYMSQFGQALEAHGIPYGPAQQAATAKALAALSAAVPE